MKKIVKILCVICIVMAVCSSEAFAANEIENKHSQEEVNIETDSSNAIVDKLETLLDPNNDTLEKEVTKTLEEHSDNWFVRWFKGIIDAISRFLDELFELASEAAKIGVD